MYADELGKQYSGVKRDAQAESDESEQVFKTNEGPVLISTSGKSVFVSESFDLTLARKLEFLMMGAQQGNDQNQAIAVARPSHALIGSMVNFFAGCGLMRAAIPCTAQPVYTEDSASSHSLAKLQSENGLQQAEIGIIGGSGLYAMPGLTSVREMHVETPFGESSDALVLGELEGRKVAFLARHGRGHRLLPSELNFRANIYAIKKLGVERILSVSAVGSLKEEHKPTDFVIP